MKKTTLLIALLGLFSITKPAESQNDFKSFFDFLNQRKKIMLEYFQSQGISEQDRDKKIFEALYNNEEVARIMQLPPNIKRLIQSWKTCHEHDNLCNDTMLTIAHIISIENIDPKLAKSTYKKVTDPNSCLLDAPGPDSDLNKKIESNRKNYYAQSAFSSLVYSTDKSTLSKIPDAKATIIYQQYEQLAKRGFSFTTWEKSLIENEQTMIKECNGNAACESFWNYYFEKQRSK